LPLPMIRNRKTVDPRDKTSPAVIQLETAMGAAIECFPGSAAIEVPRTRFAPVKTTADLFALRSDAYEILPDGQVRLHPDRAGMPPDISLSDEYKLVDALDSLGVVPRLLHCRSLSVDGPVRFDAGVVVKGDVRISSRGPERARVPAGIYENQEVSV
jgi:UTP--glucose-1-phosphate uridylyltransferase